MLQPHQRSHHALSLVETLDHALPLSIGTTGGLFTSACLAMACGRCDGDDLQQFSGCLDAVEHMAGGSSRAWLVRD